MLLLKFPSIDVTQVSVFVCFSRHCRRRHLHVTLLVNTHLIQPNVSGNAPLHYFAQNFRYGCDVRSESYTQHTHTHTPPLTCTLSESNDM
jgi:hypothetical protein